MLINMRMIKISVLSIFFSVCSQYSVAATGDLTADQIVLEAYRHTHWLRVDKLATQKTGRKVATLINRGRGGRVTINTFDNYVNSDFDDPSIETKTLAIFQSGKQRGLGLLMTSYTAMEKPPSILTWLPELRKVRRFLAPAHDDAWAGSVMTFGEVFLRRPEHEKHELLGRENIDYCLAMMSVNEHKKLSRLTLPVSDCSFKGREVYQLKSTTKFKNWWYDYHISDIDSENYLPYKTVYFKNHQPVKTIWIAWKHGGRDASLVHYPYYIFGRVDATKFESLFYVPEETVRWNVDLPDRFWSERTLRKIKR